MLAGKRQSLDAGCVLLADFASEPVRVQQIDVGRPELAEARDALSGNVVPTKQVRRQLQSIVRGLAKRDETVREFVGDARGVK